MRCSDGSYYVGHTDSLERRIVAHNRGNIPGYTSGHRPLDRVFAEEFQSRDEAFQRKRQVKGWSRRKKEALIKQDWEHLRQLARAHGSTGSP
ncbi:MAG: GIY-YIG nuclease family protein [Chloroflexi bacterium]|nr:GIY-YIG nuclease family protein [Chloroflexota bacterium]MCZ6866708.1 GIY-YIG nuclease family protein [Chloroflexota bacterium]